MTGYPRPRLTLFDVSDAYLAIIGSIVNRNWGQGAPKTTHLNGSEGKAERSVVTLVAKPAAALSQLFVAGIRARNHERDTGTGYGSGAV